jgi:polyisoprenoid-binding protein YceI
MRKKSLVMLAVLLAASFAFGDDYAIDKNHSQVAFGVRHMGLSTVHGRFTDFSGTIHLDPNDMTKSSVEVVIKTASITTDQPMRDKDLTTSADFFDVAKYPEMTFKSTKIEKRGDGYVAIGNLTIKDVTKQVEIPFTLVGPTKIEHQGQSQMRLAVEGSTKIDRRDFKVTKDPAPLIGDDINIELSLEAGSK